MLKIRLPEAPRGGRITLSLEGAHKRYGEHEVYGGIDLAIERGTRVALVGPNGAGKTTLLKMLAGVLPLDGGDSDAWGTTCASATSRRTTPSRWTRSAACSTR